MSVTKTQQTPPPYRPINPANIPQEMQDQNRWLGWRWTAQRDADGHVRKSDKPPIAIDGSMGSSTDPNKWSSFNDMQDARSADQQRWTGLFSGLGFALEGSGIFGMDIDNCRNPVTGEVTELATDIVRLADTYCEISPSGEGLKLFFTGELSEDKAYMTKNKAHDVELYSKGRYFTVTGNVFNLDGSDTPKPMAKAGKQVKLIRDTYFRLDERLNATDIDVQWEIEAAAAALEVIDDDYAVDYDQWLRVGMALKWIADDEHCFQLWHEFSDRSVEPDSEADLRAKWQSFPGRSGAVTAGTLHHMAKESDPSYVVPKKGRPQVRNYVTRKDGDKTERVAQQLPQIVAQCERVGFEFYLRGNDLIARDAINTVHEIKNATQLIAVLSQKADVDFLRTGPTKPELFESLKKVAKPIRALEPAPHNPPLPDVLYTHLPIIASSDTTEIDKVVSATNPGSEHDASLIMASIMTTYWGGSPGTRPMILLTPQEVDGIGSGKTSSATLIGSYGSLGEGTYMVRRFRDEKDVGQFAKHYVTPSKYSVRTLIVDNAKGQFGGEAAESLVTCKVINGHAMYEGLGAVPNYITIIVATNSTDVTPDIASRAVQIYIKSAVWGPDYDERVAGIDRERLWSEVAGFFQRPTVGLSEFTRFPVWCQEILGRMPNGDELVRVIKERSRALADNTETAREIRERIELILRMRGHDTTTAVVLLPASVLADAMSGIDGNKYYTSRSVTTLLKSHLDNPALHELSVNKDNTVRGFIWRGMASSSTTPKAPLDDREAFV